MLTLLLESAKAAVLVLLIPKVPDPLAPFKVFSYPVTPSCSSFSDDSIHSDCAFARSLFFLDCIPTDEELVGTIIPLEEIGSSHFNGVNG